MQEKEKGQQKLQQKQQYVSILPFYEKLERYNIDNSNKKRVFIFWFIFGLLLIAVFITSHYTPEAFIVKTNGSQLSNTHHQNCQNPVSFQNNTLYCEQFSQKNPKIGLLLKNLTPLNQFAQINVVFLPNKGKPSFIKIDQVFRIELMSLKRKKIQIDENRAVIGFEKGQDVKILQNLQFNSQNLQLTNILMEDQRIQIGYQINLGYYRQFKTNDALFIINFLNFDPTLTQFYDVVANAILINPQYTKFMIIIRAIFVCIMIVSSIAFHYFLKQKNFFKMPKEQRVVFILSILIILFNDPYYFIGVFKPNVISVLIESLFITGFIIGLLFSWIYMLRTINYQTRQQDYSLTYKERVIYIFVSLGYFIIIFLFNYQVNRYSYSQNPIVAFHKIFKLMIIITSVIFSIILLYIIYQYGRIIAVWQNLIWRNKIYILFNVFFIFLLFLFILAGWFSFYDQSSQKFQILYASMNIYILYLQYSFTIPRDKIQSGLNDGSIFQEIHSSATIKIRYNHFQKDGGVLVDLSKSQIENKVNIPADSLQQQIIDEYQ